MVRALLRNFSSVLLAPCCLVCGERGMAGLDLCTDCVAALPWNLDVCRQCGLALPAAAADCDYCSLVSPPYTLTQVALRYAFPVDSLLRRFKFHGDLAGGAVLATLMQWALDPAERPQMLVPVPLHRSRLRGRGYDQALELAKALSRECRLPLCRDRLVRLRATERQTELNAEARQQNVRDAFAIRPGPALPEHVALVDDVMTTGATVSECAEVLLAAGVQRVDIWAVARAL